MLTLNESLNILNTDFTSTSFIDYRKYFISCKQNCNEIKDYMYHF